MDEVTKKLRHLKEKDPNRFAEALIHLTEEEVELILYDGNLWLRPEQMFHEYAESIILFSGGRGAGKLVWPDTDVLTHNRGWIKMKDIQVGDKVFDENGKPCNVLEVHEPPLDEIGDTYELFFSDGSSIKTCEDHQWTTWTHRDIKQFLRNKQNGSFPPKDWASFVGDIWDASSRKPVGNYGPKVRTTREIIDTLYPDNKRKDLNHCIPLCGKLEYDEVHLPIDPYVMITDAVKIPKIDGLRCITVDSPNHLWLVGKNLIPTHNSFSGAHWIKKMVLEHGQRRVALVAPTQSECRDIMVEGPSGLLAVHRKSDRPQYISSKALVEWPNGAVAKMYSSEVPDSIRGGNTDVAWGDELSSWKNDDAFDQLMLTLRTGKSQALFTTTPKPTKLMKNLYKRALNNAGVRLITASTYANLANLSGAFKEQIISAYEGSRLGRQELEGLLLEDVEGALWNNNDIVECGLSSSEMPESFKRTVVALDPSGGGNDDCGICVAGLGFDDIVYIIEDATEKLHPSKWAEKTVKLYEKYSTSCIVYEANYGGKMVESTLESVQKNLPLKPVNAKKNKILRAEPVATLYQRGRVKHNRGLTQLEEEMTTYDGSGKSPNRLDAMVYAVLELVGKQRSPAKTFDFHI